MSKDILGGQGPKFQIHFSPYTFRRPQGIECMSPDFHGKHLYQLSHLGAHILDFYKRAITLCL